MNFKAIIVIAVLIAAMFWQNAYSSDVGVPIQPTFPGVVPVDPCELAPEFCPPKPIPKCGLGSLMSPHCIIGTELSPVVVGAGIDWSKLVNSSSADLVAEVVSASVSATRPN